MIAASSSAARAAAAGGSHAGQVVGGHRRSGFCTDCGQAGRPRSPGAPAGCRATAPRGLSLAQIRSIDARHPARVIVVLRRQFTGLPADRTHIRGAWPWSDRGGRARVPDPGRRRAGASHLSHPERGQRGRDPRERQRLAHESDVAAVVPDVLVSAPAQHRRHRSPAARARRRRETVRRCVRRIHHPLVEPEGLSLIHADQLSGVDGSGVKVGFLGESIDVNNPDFIRPDGSHVITDYQDFTGEGDRPRRMTSRRSATPRRSPPRGRPSTICLTSSTPRTRCPRAATPSSAAWRPAPRWRDEGVR